MSALRIARRAGAALLHHVRRRAMNTWAAWAADASPRLKAALRAVAALRHGMLRRAMNGWASGAADERRLCRCVERWRRAVRRRKGERHADRRRKRRLRTAMCAWSGRVSDSVRSTEILGDAVAWWRHRSHRKHMQRAYSFWAIRAAGDASWRRSVLTLVVERWRMRVLSRALNTLGWHAAARRKLQAHARSLQTQGSRRALSTWALWWRERSARMRSVRGAVMAFYHVGKRRALNSWIARVRITNSTRAVSTPALARWWKRRLRRAFATLDWHAEGRRRLRSYARAVLRQGQRRALNTWRLHAHGLAARGRRRRSLTDSTQRQALRAALADWATRALATRARLRKLHAHALAWLRQGQRRALSTWQERARSRSAALRMGLGAVSALRYGFMRRALNSWKDRARLTSVAQAMATPAALSWVRHQERRALRTLRWHAVARRQLKCCALSLMRRGQRRALSTWVIRTYESANRRRSASGVVRTLRNGVVRRAFLEQR